MGGSLAMSWSSQEKLVYLAQQYYIVSLLCIYKSTTIGASDYFMDPLMLNLNTISFVKKYEVILEFRRKNDCKALQAI